MASPQSGSSPGRRGHRLPQRRVRLRPLNAVVIPAPAAYRPPWGSEYDEDPSETQEELRELREELNRVLEQIGNLHYDLRSTELEVRELRADLAYTQQALSHAQAQLARGRVPGMHAEYAASRAGLYMQCYHL